MTTETGARQVAFLREHGGPTVNHLLSLHLDERESSEFADNHAALLQLPAVQYWKQNVPTTITSATVLGSRDSCFENAVGKLLAFGLTVDDILSPKQLDACFVFLGTTDDDSVYDSLARDVVAGSLAVAGCSHEVVRKTVSDRVDALSNFVTTSPIGYDIYVDDNGREGKKALKPILYANNIFLLPLIYDIYFFSRLYPRAARKTKEKIDAVIAYVAHADYQALDYGYGTLKAARNRIHSMGWSAHLPCFTAALTTPYFKQGLLHRMALFAGFENAVVRTWLDDTLAQLAEYKLDDTRFCLPGDLMPEVKNSYFMNGRHTSLNEDRKRKMGRIVESTYYAALAGRTI